MDSQYSKVLWDIYYTWNQHFMTCLYCRRSNLGFNDSYCEEGERLRIAQLDRYQEEEQWRKDEIHQGDV